MTETAAHSKRKGIAAAKAGQATLARLLLRRAVVEDPKAGEAWYWLSEVVEDPAQRADCLRRALALNPADVPARAALERLTAPPPAVPSPAPPAVPRPSPETSSSSQKTESRLQPEPVEPAKALSPAGVPTSESRLQPELVEPAKALSPIHAPRNTRHVPPSHAPMRFLRGLAAFVAGALIVAGPAYYLHVTGQLPSPRPLPAVATLPSAATAAATRESLAATVLPSVATQPAPPVSQVAAPLPSPTLSPTAQAQLASSLYQQAAALLAEKKYVEAIAALAQVIAQAPEDSAAFNSRGYAYIQLAAAERNPPAATADLRQAIADLDQAIALEPGNPTPYANRAAAYDQLARAEPYRETRLGYRAKVVADLTQADALGDARVTDDMLAVAHLAAGECDAALKIFDGLLSNDLSPRLFAGRAAANECRGEYWPALKDVDRALAESPQNGEWMTLRAGILRDMGLLDEALAQITKAIELEPYSGAQRYFLRATVLYDLGRVDLALDDIQRGASNTREQWGEMFYVLGRLALAEGQRSVAHDYFAHAEATLDEGPFLQRVRREMTQNGF